jgi:hypothetical protein
MGFPGMVHTAVLVCGVTVVADSLQLHPDNPGRAEQLVAARWRVGCSNLNLVATDLLNEQFQCKT